MKREDGEPGTEKSILSCSSMCPLDIQEEILSMQLSIGFQRRDQTLALNGVEEDTYNRHIWQKAHIQNS